MGTFFAKHNHILSSVIIFKLSVRIENYASGTTTKNKKLPQYYFNCLPNLTCKNQSKMKNCNSKN